MHIKIIIALFCCLILPGCAVQSGNVVLAKQNRETLDKILVKGETTKEEVVKIFGEPNDIDVLKDGRVKWVYKHIRKSEMARNYIPIVKWFSSGTNDKKRKLIIIFKDDVIDSVASTLSSGETTFGFSNTN